MRDRGRICILAFVGVGGNGCRKPICFRDDGHLCRRCIFPFPRESAQQEDLRAVDVILARYPEGQVPRPVYLLTGKVVGNVAATGQSNQTEETKTLLATAAGTLDRQVPADPESTVAVRQLPPRVYIQIFDEATRFKAKEIQAILRSQGLLVPGIENVSAKGAPVRKPVVKYFNDSDANVAERIRSTLAANGFPESEKQKAGGKVNPGSLEIWLPGS